MLVGFSKYIVFIRGVIQSYLVALKVNRLVNKHGSFVAIPTKSLRAIKGAGELLVMRQRVKIAFFRLNGIVRSLGMPPLYKLGEYTCAWVRYEQTPISDKIDAVSEAPSVFEALVKLAIETDNLNYERLMVRLDGHTASRYQSMLSNDAHYV